MDRRRNDENPVPVAPSSWLSYVLEDDVAVMTKKAESLDATVGKGVAEVKDMGKLSVIIDPTGAVFAVWQPKKMGEKQSKEEKMKLATTLIFTVILIAGFAAFATAGMKGKDVKSMSKEEQIKLAESGAPPHISRDATIMIFSADGKLTEAKKGTNGFTCIPDIDEQEVPDPMCGDGPAMQWGDDYMKLAPKPTNVVPGVAYMAKGGWHWEKDGRVVMDRNTPGAKRVKEPPHWMILWPFDPKASGLMTDPGKFGTYIMFEGTPYAHLMIYQDPNKMK